MLCYLKKLKYINTLLNILIYQVKLVYLSLKKNVHLTQKMAFQLRVPDLQNVNSFQNFMNHLCNFLTKSQTILLSSHLSILLYSDKYKNFLNK